MGLVRMVKIQYISLPSYDHLLISEQVLILTGNIQGKLLGDSILSIS